MTATATMQSIDRIQQRHDPEHDIPGAYCHPLVTSTDMELLNINLALIERCDQLERRIAEQDVKIAQLQSLVDRRHLHPL